MDLKRKNWYTYYVLPDNHYTSHFMFIGNEYGSLREQISASWYMIIKNNYIFMRLAVVQGLEIVYSQ
jgi:hypothetical protein